ncbi:MoaD/ThiS family protein [Rhodococcus sp. X156]|uniref:MoaD/ThiS family protein n=1 Tax=Rhodococcus sp. X156 TaxID=2499145 RepID=UPI001F49DF3F|nr:MoaD/ThiS family protein [Rhodococcus sp. X156]
MSTSPESTSPTTSAPAIELEVRYFAAARAAAGTPTEIVSAPASATLSTLLAVLAERHPPLVEVLKRCSFLLDEVAVRDRERPLPPGGTVDVLPPFAGG